MTIEEKIESGDRKRSGRVGRVSCRVTSNVVGVESDV